MGRMAGAGANDAAWVDSFFRDPTPPLPRPDGKDSGKYNNRRVDPISKEVSFDVPKWSLPKGEAAEGLLAQKGRILEESEPSRRRIRSRARKSSPVPPEQSLRRMEGIAKKKRGRSSGKKVRISDAVNVRGSSPANLVDGPPSQSKDHQDSGQRSKLQEDHSSSDGQQLSDVEALLHLKESDLELESLQTCHRCGKRAKQGRVSCKSSFCALNGKRFSICQGCLARLRNNMTHEHYKMMMGHTQDPNWHCPRCIEPHFLSGTGICCCSFHRRGMQCPWHRSTPKLCCSSARVSFNQKRKRAQIAEFRGTPSQRAKLCKNLDKLFSPSKILFINARERCYSGFPCKRCRSAPSPARTPTPAGAGSASIAGQAKHMGHIGTLPRVDAPQMSSHRLWPDTKTGRAAGVAGGSGLGSAAVQIKFSPIQRHNRGGGLGTRAEAAATAAASTKSTTHAHVSKKAKFTATTSGLDGLEEGSSSLFFKCASPPPFLPLQIQRMSSLPEKIPVHVSSGSCSSPGSPVLSTIPIAADWTLSDMI